MKNIFNEIDRREQEQNGSFRSKSEHNPTMLLKMMKCAFVFIALFTFKFLSTNTNVSKITYEIANESAE